MPPKTPPGASTPTPRRAGKPSPPSAAERKLIAKVASEAKITAVLLHELHCTRVAALPKEPLKTNFKVQAKHWVEERDKRHYLKVMVRIQATTEPLAHEVIAVLLAIYEVGPTITKENAFPFAKYNAVFNCWPYWRELYQNVSGRMGIPAPMSPLLVM